MKITNLQDLFIRELKDLYSAETQLLKGLAKMSKAASNEEIKAAFDEHLEQTKEHVHRLEQIADECDCSLSGMKCKAMEGLIEEGSELMSDVTEESVRDASLIGIAHRIEHYEIAAYGTAHTLATCLGHSDAAALLAETLEEEEATEEKLVELDESIINAEAT